jgi:predicted ferric reductase
MLHLPPRTPQLNPIEVEWREIKAAIADIFFDGLDRMRDAIRRMIRNGEIPIVKTFDWLLAA